jgi:glycosyltransferase involved in cell wall biosynthesis
MSLLVSVIVAVYNGEKYIRETMDSILNQAYRDLEIIVINDGSTDSTSEIINSYIKLDPRVKMLTHQNKGVSISRNRGIQCSKGDFIAPCDADDIWYPQKIEKQVAVMESSNTIGLVYGWTKHIDANGIPTGYNFVQSKSGHVFYSMLEQELIGSGSVPLLRRSALEEVGLYPEFNQLEDFDLYLRIAEKWEFGVVEDFVTQYRQIPESNSRNFKLMEANYENIMQRIANNHPELSSDLIRRHRSQVYYWLADLSKQSRDVNSCFRYIAKATRLDWKYLSKFKTYKLLIVVLLKKLL